MTTRLLTFLLFLLLPTFAQADNYDTRTLHSRGAWIVELVHNTDTGGLWCNAQTVNRSGQTFSITAYDNESMAIFIFDESWDLAKRSIDFIIDVDRHRWTVSGDAEGIGVTAALNDADQSVAFLKQVAAGNSVTIRSDDKARIADFSLTGSRASLVALFDCWDSITAAGDPF